MKIPACQGVARIMNHHEPSARDCETPPMCHPCAAVWQRSGTNCEANRHGVEVKDFVGKEPREALERLRSETSGEVGTVQSEEFIHIYAILYLSHPYKEFYSEVLNGTANYSSCLQHPWRFEFVEPSGFCAPNWALLHAQGVSVQNILAYPCSQFLSLHAPRG